MNAEVVLLEKNGAMVWEDGEDLIAREKVDMTTKGPGKIQEDKPKVAREENVKGFA